MSTGMMRVAVGGLVLVVAAGCASMGGGKKLTAAEAIDARKQLMKEQGAAWKNVQDKAKAGQIAAIVPDAEKLAATAKEIPALFPEGSLNAEKSAAKPEIWQKRADFDAKMDKMVAEAKKLPQAARADQASLKKAVDATGDACGACHEDYRKK